MTKTKKTILIICAAILMVAAVATTTVLAITGANSDENWKDYYATSYENEGQSGVDGVAVPYQIRTPEQLARMAYQINSGVNKNKKFELIASIDLSKKLWTPIGTDSHQFEGTFNGNGFAISGIRIVATSSLRSRIGLFGRAKGATIQNLFADGFVNSNYDGVGIGGVVGRGDSITLQKIASNIVVNAPKANDVAGIMGIVGGTKNKVTESFNNANVTGSAHVGGIVGRTESDIEISNIYNKGIIYSTYSYVGGILGYGDLQASKSDEIVIKYAYNYAKIYSDGSYVSGIAVFAKKIEYAYNYGDVDGYTSVSGIAHTAVEISSAVNQGNIKGIIYIGGIMATFHESQGSKVSKSSNYGMVEGDKYVGGIVGGTTDKNFVHTIEGCGNFSFVKGETFVGGVIGGGVIGNPNLSKQTAKVIIKYSFNQSTVEATDSNSGGIVGGIVPAEKDKLLGTSYYGGAVQIEYVYNTGEIKGTNYCGGIAGYLHKEDNVGTVQVKSAYNFGTISTSSKKYVGALVGRNYKDRIGIYDCYYVSGKSNPNKGLGTSGGGGANYSGTSAKDLADAKKQIAKLSNFTTNSIYPAGGRWSSSFTIYDRTELTTKFSSLIWQTSAAVNDGKPHLKNFYW